ncbi:hypothetical protein ESCAB7627_4617 [Escherichia albertii TW07627]|uniref:Uncharacterized protein n=1 Tax=Escherichia albertii (strain TW07627) TaxID=502347 RepID=A0ABC9NSI3_ESCAT|nr:hypothetical protein ESCAB7627_4617 [Escherichia albertii TW07627]
MFKCDFHPWIPCFFDRFFVFKFQYAKLDFKYIDRFLTKQSD